MINFNVPLVLGTEKNYITDVLKLKKLCGDGKYTNLTSKLMEEKFLAKKILMTTSCTHALEMAAILADINDGDEVIMPSYTFVSTANAFALRGAKIVFVDIEKETMNIDIKCIEKAITTKTKAIVVVHYAGVSCDMDKIMQLANKNNILVIEDAAQAVMSKYKGKYLGTIGHLGCYSFHETKNYNMGEGGALIINDEQFIERAEIIREKGTDRSKFFRGQVDKYTWVDIGSSYLPSEINIAFLYGQLMEADKINNKRLELYNSYKKILSDLDRIEMPFIPNYSQHNAHMFYIKTKDIKERADLISYLKTNNIMSVFHYIPLHSSLFGSKHYIFNGDDNFTTKESERLLRLPLYYDLTIDEVTIITKKIYDFFNK